MESSQYSSIARLYPSVTVDVQLERLSTDNIPIKPCKLADIQKQKPFIPPLLCSFYDNLTCTASNTTKETADSSGSESDIEVEPNEEGLESSETRGSEQLPEVRPRRATKTREKEPRLDRCLPAKATKTQQKETSLWPRRSGLSAMTRIEEPGDRQRSSERLANLQRLVRKNPKLVCVVLFHH